MHYAMLGNGVAGIEAALALRRRDADARITLIADEHDHFYSRPALMYVGRPGRPCFRDPARTGGARPRRETPVVVKAGPEFRVERTNPLGEPISASAAVAGGRLYIRDKHLFAIGSPSGPQAVDLKPPRSTYR